MEHAKMIGDILMTGNTSDLLFTPFLLLHLPSGYSDEKIDDVWTVLMSFFSLARVEAKKHTTLIKKRACPSPFRFKKKSHGSLCPGLGRIFQTIHSPAASLPHSKIPKGLAILPIRLLIQQPTGNPSVPQ